MGECESPRVCVHICVNTSGDYFCQCHSGYRLSQDGHNCTGEREREREGGREGGRDGGREGWREGGMEGEAYNIPLHACVCSSQYVFVVPITKHLDNLPLNM